MLKHRAKITEELRNLADALEAKRVNVWEFTLKLESQYDEEHGTLELKFENTERIEEEDSY